MPELNSDVFSTDNLAVNDNFNFFKKMFNSEEHEDNEFSFSDSPYADVQIETTYICENDLSIDNDDKNLSIMTLNVQSLPAKFDDLNLMISLLLTKNSAPDIICLQEIWKFPDIVDFKIIGYHSLLYKQRSNSQGGGIGIYVRENFQVSELPEYTVFSERIFESLFVQVKINGSSPIIVGSAYRPGTPFLISMPLNFSLNLWIFSLIY